MTNVLKNWQAQKIENSQHFQELAYSEINELTFTKREGKKLTLDDNTIVTDFVSCSYLGLDLDTRVITAASKHLNETGTTFPAARTRIKSHLFTQLENLLNEIFYNAFTTTFSSLHLGHLGVLTILASGKLPSFPPDKNGFCFILDKTCHASIQIQRALLSQFGDVLIINFNNKSELENAFLKSNKNYKKPVAIADSIGSMGGVIAIDLLFELADKYKGYIYLDDAHGMSIYGKNGCGYVLDKLGYFHPRLILSTSLSKAFGSVAGVIVLPTSLDDKILKHYSSTYIFSGPPPLSSISAAIESAKIHLSNEIYMLQQRLQQNIDYFDSQLPYDYILNYGSMSPIRGIKVGDEFKAIQLSKLLKKENIAVTTAMYPTVAKSKAILRVALSALHQKSDIDHLSRILLNNYQKAD